VPSTIEFIIRVVFEPPQLWL